MNRRQLLNIGTDILLVDGMNAIFKSAYAIRNLKSGNQDTGAVYGVLKSLSSAVKEYLPSAVIITWEGKNNKDRRRELYPQYKEGRKTKDLDIQSVFNQIDILQDFSSCMGLGWLRVESYEADDCIAAIVNEYSDLEIVIMSSDQDLLQLVSPKVKWYSTGSFGQTKEINYDNFLTKMGVTIDKFLDYKMLVGDSSDNIPGISGIGDKTAKQILSKYSLEEYRNSFTEEIALPRTKKLFEPEAKKILERNRKLMDLNENKIPREELFDGLELDEYEEDGLIELLNDFEMWSILDTFGEFKEGFEAINTKEVLNV